MKLSFYKFLGMMAFVACSPSVVHAVSTGFNGDYECYIVARTLQADSFYFCGAQTQSCKGNSVNKRDSVHWQHHKDWLDREGGYFCCESDPTKSGTGVYVAGKKDGWIAKTEEVRESVTDASGNQVGTCTWTKKWNVCGWVDNPNDKCTVASENCEEGYVTRVGSNGKTRCAKACKSNEAFLSVDSDNCVAIPTDDPSTGVKQGTIVSCSNDEVWDSASAKCISLRNKTAASPAAFRDCWQCSTPAKLKSCLNSYMNGTAMSTADKKDCGKE